MKWTSMRINGFGANTDLAIQGVDSDTKYLLKAADGLGPPEKDIYVATDVNGFGDFQNDLPNLREIVLRVGLNPDYSSGETAADLRRDLNRRLYATAYHSALSITFFDDADEVGYISKAYARMIAINPWSSDPEVQVTMQCLSPYIIGPEVTVPTSGFDPTDFEFSYDGEDSTGLRIAVDFTADKSGLILDQGGYSKKIEFAYDFLDGDRLVINTDEKIMKRNRSDVWKDMVPYLTGDSSWLLISPGNNHFFFNTANLDFFDLSYVPRIWGV